MWVCEILWNLLKEDMRKGEFDQESITVFFFFLLLFFPTSQLLLVNYSLEWELLLSYKSTWPDK